MEFILASASPRRKDLLEQIGIKAQILPSEFQEASSGEDVYQLLETNTLGKLNDVEGKVLNTDKVIIAADTVVVLDGRILGKPANLHEAVSMLESLSGREHSVLTGLAISYAGKRNYQFLETKVKFKTLTKDEIYSYVNTGEGLDKAGGYAVQGLGAVFVEKIKGCYNNVVGLPLNLLYSMLNCWQIKTPKLK